MHFRMFMRRFCAFMIDNLILGVAAWALQYFIVSNMDIDVFKLLLFYIFLSVAYFALQEYSPAHATIGKRVMNLVVCNMEYKDITLVQAFGRNLVRIFNYFIYSVGYIPILFTKREQGLHDLIARTVVVDKEELEEFWAEQEEG